MAEAQVKAAADNSRSCTPIAASAGAAAHGCLQGAVRLAHHVSVEWHVHLGAEPAGVKNAFGLAQQKGEPMSGLKGMCICALNLHQPPLSNKPQIKQPDATPSPLAVRHILLFRHHLSKLPTSPLNLHIKRRMQPSHRSQCATYSSSDIIRTSSPAPSPAAPPPPLPSAAAAAFSLVSLPPPTTTSCLSLPPACAVEAAGGADVDKGKQPVHQPGASIRAAPPRGQASVVSKKHATQHTPICSSFSC